MQYFLALSFMVVLLPTEASSSCSTDFHTNSTFGKESFTFEYGHAFTVIGIFDCDTKDDFEYIFFWERSFRTDMTTLNATMKDGIVYVRNHPPQIPTPSFQMALYLTLDSERKDANQSVILVREILSGSETRSSPIMLIYPTPKTTTTSTTTATDNTTITNIPNALATTASEEESPKSSDNQSNIVILVTVIPIIVSLLVVIAIMHVRRKNRRLDLKHFTEYATAVDVVEPVYMEAMDPTISPALPPRLDSIYMEPGPASMLDMPPTRPAPLPPNRQNDEGYLTLKPLPQP